MLFKNNYYYYEKQKQPKNTIKEKKYEIKVYKYLRCWGPQIVKLIYFE